jgi:hypothetical protein
MHGYLACWIKCWLYYHNLVTYTYHLFRLNFGNCWRIFTILQPPARFFGSLITGWSRWLGGRFEARRRRRWRFHWSFTFHSFSRRLYYLRDASRDRILLVIQRQCVKAMLINIHANLTVYLAHLPSFFLWWVNRVRSLLLRTFLRYCSSFGLGRFVIKFCMKGFYDRGAQIM